MRRAIISDTHWGYAHDSEVYLEHFTRFHREVFWPEVDRRGVDAIYHAGDITDRRKYVNFRTARAIRKEFFEAASDRGLPIVAAMGNHDVQFKNHNDVSSWAELYGAFPNVRFETSAFHDDTGPRPVLFVPWICDANRQATMETIERSPARTVVGHLELNGSRMYRNGPAMEHGMDPRPFRRFDAVLSGHYHTRSVTDNVVYLGSPYEMTWSDHDDPKAFHFLTDEGLETVWSPLTLHRKMHYQDGSSLEGLDLDVRGQIVKVVVGKREDHRAFDGFMRGLETLGPARIQVVEDHLNMDVVAPDDEAVVSVEDTPVVLRRAVEAMEGVDRERLSALLQEVYAEALVRR